MFAYLGLPQNLKDLKVLRSKHNAAMHRCVSSEWRSPGLFRVQGAGFRAQGAECRVQGSGYGAKTHWKPAVWREHLSSQLHEEHLSSQDLSSQLLVNTFPVQSTEIAPASCRVPGHGRGALFERGVPTKNVKGGSYEKCKKKPLDSAIVPLRSSY